MSTPNVCSRVIVVSLAAAAVSFADGPEHWPSFRGPNGAGYTHGPTPPTHWNVETGENVRWSTAIPGLGLSSPIAWGDRIYLTTAVRDGAEQESLRVGLYGDIVPVNDQTPHRWQVLCLDRATGRILWNREAAAGVPMVKRHPKASHANSTPATDGTHVVAFFGSEGLHCYDVDGKRLWSKDFGLLDSGFFRVPPAQWGFASSPIIVDGMVIIQCDVQKDSFVAAYDVATGKELWKTARDEVPTWATPTLYESAGEKRLVLNGFKHIGGYKLATGAPVWWMKGGGDIPVPRPIVAHDLLFIANAHGSAAPVYAVHERAEGQLTPTADAPGPHLAWLKMRVGVYMQTPLIVDDLLYLCRDNGVLGVVDARSGKPKYKQRLGSGRTGFTASMVGCRDHFYVTSEEGDVFVLATGSEYRPLAHNKMNEVCMATPAIADGMLLIRTAKRLVAVSADDGLR